MGDGSPSITQRIEGLLEHLAIDRVHVGACMSGDWGGLVGTARGRVASLALIAPHLNKGVPAEATTFERPTLVISGDEGPAVARARTLAETFPDATFAGLPGYRSLIWADTIADRLEEVHAQLSAFWSRAEQLNGEPLAPVTLAATEGVHQGLHYRIQGHGPPLLLLPLSLSPSQWEPLMAALTRRFCVITLGGRHLGAVALLELRAASGYGELVTDVLDSVRLAPGEVALEVGCGSGSLSRRLLQRSAPGCRLVAADLNPYLLAEARALAQDEGIAERIQLETANAETLHFDDDGFDLAFACTVVEEGDAERMLAELTRVTKPGGRVAVMTRAVDVDWWVNLDLPDAVRCRLNAHGPVTGAGVEDHGCADASLYRRAIAAGVRPLRMGPQFATYREGPRLDDVLARLAGALEEREREAFTRAVQLGRENGSLFVCEPFHCVVGEVQ